MKQSQALKLAELLTEIYSLSETLSPLIEEGSEDFEELLLKIAAIRENIFPTYTVAFVGPVNSGKSTLLSSLIKEKGDHALASMGPSNETFVPIVISYGSEARLTLHYFGLEVLENVKRSWEHFKANKDSSRALQYKEAWENLRKVAAVLASGEKAKFVQRINLEGKSRKEVISTIREYTVSSSPLPDVYGIYKAEVAFPGVVLRELNNARFVDLFGFDEPSPLANLKYDRFISEENIDVVVYVFPNRAVTAAFYQLFEIPRFVEEVVAKGRFFVVLNKADTYPDANSPSKWPYIEQEFREVLKRQVPALRKYADNIPIFVMSAVSIDGKINHKKAKAIRDASLRQLYELRDTLRRISRDIETTSRDVELYLPTLFDLLEVFDLFAEEVQSSLSSLGDRLPEITRVLDMVSSNEAHFQRGRESQLEDFRAALQRRLESLLSQIDYANLVRIVPSELSLGNPRALFRDIVAQAQRNVRGIYRTELVRVFEELGEFINAQLLQAYREYVDLQDKAIQEELKRLRMEQRFRPLRATVDRSAQEILRFSSAHDLHMRTLRLLMRFTSWFFHKGYRFETGRSVGISQIKSQIGESVQEAIEKFMLVYVCEEPSLRNSYLPYISTGGEPTYWHKVREHVLRLNDLLSNQVQIVKWRFGLYQNRVFFVSHQKEFHDYAHELLEKKQKAQEMVIEML